MPYLKRRIQCKIGDSSNLLRKYAERLVKDEVKEQTNEVLQKIVSIIHDATPRQGDCYALLVRFVVLNEETKTAMTKQRLIYF